ncbi:MAG TPA: hypothetical protein VIJ93_06740 [bacterium]
MRFSLTSQEKKVLGFILFLWFFGLAVMGVKRWLFVHDKSQSTPSATPSPQNERNH